MEFKEIENKWQKVWEERSDLYKADDNSTKPKKYVLVEFPYPSGSGLHIGHAFTFTGGDVYARFCRMKGLNVLFPMGWDAFGLPTENYAIKTKQKPQKVTKDNTEMFKRQMKRLGFSFDWSREINTTDPDYYKWTQWIFVQLFKKGLAYKKEMPINWCPSCKIGLANEEVVDGKCERCGSEVSRRTISQWVVKITEYADRLIEGLKDTDFVEKVRAAQINWIGKSEGARIRFKILNSKSEIKELEVFTTRPDTLYGATFMVIAPEHPLALELAKEDENIKNYLKQARSKSELERTELSKDKTGVNSKLYAINPVNNKEIPIWISDFVLASYGTGAIMSVPAHDERDFDFAKKFDLPIIPVIKQNHDVARSYLMGATKIADGDLERIGIKILRKSDSGSRELEIPLDKVNDYENLIVEKLDNGFWNEYIGEDIVFIFKDKNGKIEKLILNEETERKIDKLAAEYNGEGWTKKQSVWAWLADCDWYKDYIFNADTHEGVMVNSDFLNGMVPDEAMKKAIEWIKEKGIGEGVNSYHLRDWIFSRQHYWGEPIPMIFCENCAKKQKEEILNSKLDNKEKEIKLQNAGWMPVPENELPVKLPEVDAYEPTDDGKSPLSKIESFVKTKCPVCGGEAERETDTMPNWAGSDWYYLRYIDPHNENKLADFDILNKWLPIDIYVGGDEHNTLHLLYSRFIHQFLYDLGIVPTSEPYYRRYSHGVILGPDNQRMSKSRGNVIVPETVADKYGVDVVRMYLMFMGPYDGTMAWNENTLMGVKRFLDRFEKFVDQQIINQYASKEDSTVTITKLIYGVGQDLENFGFNTAIAKMMQAINELKEVNLDELKKMIIILAPLAPYTAEELWNRVGGEGLVHEQLWPAIDEKYLVESKIRIPAAVNGKVRSEIVVDSDRQGNQQEVIKLAKEDEKIKQWIDGKEIVKEIYVAGKMVNFVVKL